MSEGGRISTNNVDYFNDRQKKLDLADRRPLLRRASDLVGPGIGAYAVRVTDLGNVLATFNGYFSVAAGATGSPNGTDPFVGFVVSDETLGGLQNFTSLITGTIYQRSFTRNSLDSTALYWTNWKIVSA